MRECGSCSFCCWAFTVLDVPDELKGIETKPALSHCQHECEGCAIHSRDDYPPMCKTFVCPYLTGEDIHRPDVFQSTLEELRGSVGNYIPTIPTSIPVNIAERLIKQTRTFPAAILVLNEWVRVLLSADRENDGTWIVREEPRWGDLFEIYNESLNLEAQVGCVMI